MTVGSQVVPPPTGAQRVGKALEMISEYGGIDGGHHKQWVLDQVVQILATDYAAWIEEQCAGEDGPDTYEWDRGIPP